MCIRDRNHRGFRRWLLIALVCGFEMTAGEQSSHKCFTSVSEINIKWKPATSLRNRIDYYVKSPNLNSLRTECTGTELSVCRPCLNPSLSPSFSIVGSRTEHRD